MGLFKRNTIPQESKMDFVFRVPARTLDDFAGYDSLKEEGRKRMLQATQNYFLEGTESYIRMLLEGVAGVGKSYFASCLAGEATRMITLNKKVQQRLAAELSETVREEIEQSFKIDVKNPKYRGPFGSIWGTAWYLWDKFTDRTTPALIEHTLEDFKTVLQAYKIKLLNDGPVPEEERTKFNQKVDESYSKKLKALVKKKILLTIFSNSKEEKKRKQRAKEGIERIKNLESSLGDAEKRTQLIEELEDFLEMEYTEKITGRKKAKDSAFEELIMEKYSKLEDAIQLELLAEYSKNLKNSIVKTLLEVEPESEEGQRLLKRFASKSISELTETLGETKPIEVIRAKRKAWYDIVGPPKTAKEMVAYLEVNGSDFAKFYVGVGAHNVGNMFKEVRQKLQEFAAVVLNIEELDAIGSNRLFSSGNDERRATLNKLLQEISGPNSDELNKGLILVASTNLAQLLDPAILRSGRFGIPIPVRVPNEYDLDEIIKYYFTQLKLDTDVDLDLLGVDLYGATGADIKELKNEADIVTKMQKKTTVSEKDIRSALYRVMFGIPNDPKFTKEDKEQLAYHEAGHALAIEMKDRHKEVAELVLDSYGGAAAFVRDRLRKDRPKMQSRRDIMDRLMVWYGGVIAEEVIYGKDDSSCNSGTSDIFNATEMVKRLIRAGMVGATYLHLGTGDPDEKILTEKAKEIVDKVVDETRNFMEENKAYLTALKEIGGIKQRLSGEEVKAICRLGKDAIEKVTETIVKKGCSDEGKYFNLINGIITPEEY